MPENSNQQSQPSDSSSQSGSNDEVQFKGMDGRNITTEDTTPVSSDEDLKSALDALAGNIQSDDRDRETVTANAGIEATITSPVQNRAKVETPISQTAEDSEEEQEIKSLADVFRKFEEEASKKETTVEQQSAEPTTTTTTEQSTFPQVPEVSFEDKEKAYLTRIQELESQLVGWEEFKKNPGQFLSKNFPAFMKQSFDPLVYVEEKMKEAGWEDFEPDPKEALRVGTPSWKFVQDQMKYLSEAEEYMNQAQANEIALLKEAEAKFNQAKEKVKQKYKMTELDFQEKVWNKLQNMDNAQALELLTDAIMALEELKKVKENIKKQTDRSKVPPSVLDVSTSKNVTTDEDIKAIRDLFPTRFGNNF